jgi:hypothetical protein
LSGIYPTRRALCVGTNYTGTGSQLAGCVNDAASWAGLLRGRGWTVEELVAGAATRAAILAGFQELTGRAGDGGRVVLTWSGHGTWVPDRDGDEADGRDEAICPDDYRSAGVVSDDELYAVFAAAPRGSRVVFVADACFSGTLQRFAGPVEHTWAGSPRRARFLPPGEFLDGADLRAARAVEHIPVRGRARRSALALSACSDTQVTYDTTVDGVPQGLFSHVAVAALQPLPAGSSYRAWHRAIRRMLPSVDYPDVTPQLDGTSTQKRWTALA